MNQIRTLVLAAAALLVPCFASAQVTTPQGAVSDQINAKLRKLDLLIKMEPLALQKTQYPDLLHGLAQARELARRELTDEDNTLEGLDTELTDLVDNAVKGVYPPSEKQVDIQKTIQKMEANRIKVGTQMVKAVHDAISAGLNEGQKKAMAGSFKDSYIQSGMKDGSLPEEVKIDYFIRVVFLDPLAYDLLVEMEKHAS